MGTRSAVNREYGSILLATIATFMGFYCPQPLLATICRANDVSQPVASLLITVAIVPFAVAPFVYGRILRAISLTRLLNLSMFGCGLCLAIGSMATQSFAILLAVRILQGFLLPAVLLCLTTRIASMYTGRQLQNMLALYSAMTIVGADGGRILAGFLCSTLSVGHALAFFAIVQLLALVPGRHIADSKQTGSRSFSLLEFRNFLASRDLRPALYIGPVCVFAYSAILTFLPFRITDISPGVSEVLIGLVYVCGLLNAITSSLNKYLLQFFRDEWNLLFFACILFLLSIPVFLIKHIVFIIVATIFVNVAFSIVYSNTPGIVNRISNFDKALTNSMYLAIHYFISSLGAFIPIIIYSNCGIESFLIVLAISCLINIYFVVKSKKNTVLS